MERSQTAPERYLPPPLGFLVTSLQSPAEEGGATGPSGAALFPPACRASPPRAPRAAAPGRGRTAAAAAWPRGPAAPRAAAPAGGLRALGLKPRKFRLGGLVVPRNGPPELMELFLVPEEWSNIASRMATAWMPWSGSPEVCRFLRQPPSRCLSFTEPRPFFCRNQRTLGAHISK